jgi:hypothetical protein
MTLRGLVLCVVLGSTLTGWFVWPHAESAPPAVDVGLACSSTTRVWAEQWSRASGGTRKVRRMTVLCQPDGRVVTARVDWYSRDGHGLVAWRPDTTFGGPVPRAARERIDVFDGAGRLIEYVVLDRAAERLELYRESGLAGYGRFDPSSRGVQRFDLDGRRQTSLALPIPPRLPE